MAANTTDGSVWICEVLTSILFSHKAELAIGWFIKTL